MLPQPAFQEPLQRMPFREETAYPYPYEELLQRWMLEVLRHSVHVEYYLNATGNGREGRWKTAGNG